MSASAIRKDLHKLDPELLARGLREVVRHLGASAVGTPGAGGTWEEQRPADFDARKAELADLEPRLLELSHHTDEVVRELAADALGAWLGPAALQRLLELTQDEVVRVKASAVGALEGWPDDSRAREALLDAVGTGHWTIRMRAARALARFDGQDVDEALLQGLVDPDSYVRTNCADSLKKRPAAPYLPRLRKLADYPAPHLLDAAIELLGAVGTPEDEKFLAQVGGWLNLSQPGFIRRWARSAAQQIRQRHKA